MPRKNKKFEYNDTFPRRFRGLIDETKGITQEKIAEIVGATRQTVGNWCSGKSAPDAVALLKIAREFNVSIDWLLLESAPKQVNATLESVCRYTGLTEGAVKRLAGQNEKALLPATSSIGELLEICQNVSEFYNEVRTVTSRIIESGCAAKISESLALYKNAASRLQELLKDVSRDAMLEMSALDLGQLIQKITELNTICRMRKYDAKEAADNFVNDFIQTDLELCEAALEKASLQQLVDTHRALSLDEFADIMISALKAVEENKDGEHPETDQ